MGDEVSRLKGRKKKKGGRGKTGADRPKAAPKRVIQIKRRRVVAITGVTGFIGSNLLRRLQTNDHYERFVLMDIEKPQFPVRRSKFYKLDLSEPTADAYMADILKREECDTFVHLAFLQHPVLRTTYAHELEAIGTMYVLNACAERNIRKIVIASSTMVYGAHPTNPNFLTEDHRLRAGGFRMLTDRVEIENQVRTYRRKHPDTVITVLRPCFTLGPRIKSFLTRYLSLPFVYTILGYDPLMQFVHEDDVIEAFKLATDRDFSGEYNIVGKGVLPVSTLMKLAGKINVKMPSFVLYPMIDTLWLAQLAITPSAYLDYMRYLFVADGARAAEEMGFEARYSTKEAWESFVGTMRLRKMNLAEE